MGQPIRLEPPTNALSRALGVQNAMQQNALNGMQMQDMQAQRQDRQAQAQARAQALAKLPPPPDDAPQQMHLAYRATQSGLMPVEKYIGLVMGDEKPMSVPAGGSVYQGGRIVATAPEKTPAPEKTDPNKPFMTGPDGSLVPNQAYQDYEMRRAAAGRAPRASAGGGGAAPAPTALPPKLKPGERWNPVAERVEAVPGSDLEQKQRSAHAKDDAALRGVETKMDTAISKITSLLDDKNKGAFESNFGGYNAYATQYLPGASSDARKSIDSIKSDLKAAGLEMMRSGGSIGQMTQQEWPIVERMIAVIDPVLGEEKAREQFGNILQYMQTIKENARAVYEREWGDSQYAVKASEKPAPASAQSTAPAFADKAKQARYEAWKAGQR